MVPYAVRALWNGTICSESALEWYHMHTMLGRDRFGMVPYAEYAPYAYSTRYQHTATHCNTLQHTATHCNTLQHTAIHCNTCILYSLPKYARYQCMLGDLLVPFQKSLRVQLATRHDSFTPKQFNGPVG